MTDNQIYIAAGVQDLEGHCSSVGGNLELEIARDRSEGKVARDGDAIQQRGDIELDLKVEYDRHGVRVLHTEEVALAGNERWRAIRCQRGNTARNIRQQGEIAGAGARGQPICIEEHVQWTRGRQETVRGKVRPRWHIDIEVADAVATDKVRHVGIGNDRRLASHNLEVAIRRWERDAISRFRAGRNDGGRNRNPDRIVKINFALNIIADARYR